MCTYLCSKIYIRIVLKYATFPGFSEILRWYCACRTFNVVDRVELGEVHGGRCRRFLLPGAEAGDALEAVDHEVHDLVVVRLLAQIQPGERQTERSS